ncbi:hypothetical protein K438DRAFT_1599848, partial [Mycena galopus ATCC 62051]
ESSTSNLKKHADTCWGKDVVKARLKGAADAASRDGNIFSAFARVGQRPVKVTHRAHTEELLEAGRPDFKMPSRCTVARDLNTAHEQCSGRVQQFIIWLLYLNQNYPGRLSFATDTWTSPRAFVTWTVHLQHEGEPLVFLLDIYEVPEVRPS